jgi:hypothetical protein
MLDVQSTDKGMLVPRIDYNDKPASPAQGLLIYVTANGPEGNDAFYYYNNSSWIKIAEENSYIDVTSSNVFLGYQSGAVSSGSNNSFIGYQSGLNNSTGSYNFFSGYKAGRANTTGSYNIFIGYRAGYYNVSGNNNLFLGAYAGENCTGGSNVFIGNRAGSSEEDVSDLLFIENTSTSSPLIWGDFLYDMLVINGNGTHNYSNRTFYVNGTAGGGSPWFNDSDERMKKNISTIENPLDKVLALRGVNFEWQDTQSHGTGLQMGFIAQETEKVIPEVVGAPEDKEQGHYSMQYAPITALLVEAVKEQNIIIENQKKQIEQQQKEMEKILDALSDAGFEVK